MTEYNLNKNYFAKIDSSLKAYFLGFITADGGIDNDGITISTAKDKNILEEFLKEVNSNRPPKKLIRYDSRFQKEYSSWRIFVYSRKMVRDLAKYGVIRNKTFKTYFPKDLIPKRFYRDFIRGVFDGDGSTSKYKGMKKYKTKFHYFWHYIFSIAGNLSLLKEIQNILVKECNLPHSRILPKKRIHLLYVWSKPGIQRIYNYLYYPNCICIKRKQNKFLSI